MEQAFILYMYNFQSSQILYYFSTSNELVTSKKKLNFYQKLLSQMLIIF